jgi:hypothetical protein
MNVRRNESRAVPAQDPERRGFHAAYRSGEINHCPACGHTHWYVGRLHAECGFCTAALPLMFTRITGDGRFPHPPRFDEAA